MVESSDEERVPVNDLDTISDAKTSRSGDVFASSGDNTLNVSLDCTNLEEDADAVVHRNTSNMFAHSSK